MTDTPAAPSNGPLPRPTHVRFEVCIYDRSRHIGREPAPYKDIIARAKHRRLEVDVTDDVGQPLPCYTDPATVRVDGNQVFVVVEGALSPEHKVATLLGIPDLTEAELADLNKHRADLGAVSVDVLHELSRRAVAGATPEQLNDYAAEQGLAPAARESLVAAIIGIQKDSPGALLAFSKMGGAPAEAAAQDGAGVVSGGLGAGARITGEAVAALSPDGKVG